MAKQKTNKFFLYLVPVFVLLGALVLTITSKRITTPAGCNIDNYSGQFSEGDNIAVFENKTISVPVLANASE